MADVRIAGLPQQKHPDELDATSVILVDDPTEADATRNSGVDLRHLVANSLLVSQTSHGFSVGEIVQVTSTDNTFQLAQADSEANADVDGIVIAVPDANSFIMQTPAGSPLIVGAAVPAGAAGTVWYLDQSTAGAVTSTQPATGIRKPLFKTIANGTLAIWTNRESYGGEIYGTLQTASQPNVTAVGILTEGDVAGNFGPISISYGGTGGALVDPNENALFSWDDATEGPKLLGIGSGLSISGGDLTATGGIGAKYTESTSNPSVNDDSSAGYSAGSIWANTSTNVVYICLDDSVGAADWNRIGPLSIYENVQTDSGLASADNGADTLTLSGAGGISTSSSGDTVTITGPSDSKSFTFPSPTDSEDEGIFFTDRAITVTKIAHYVKGSTPSVTFTIVHDTTANGAGNEVVTGGTTSTTETGATVTSFNDATIPANSWVRVKTTAQSGTVDSLHVTVVFTID